MTGPAAAEAAAAAGAAAAGGVWVWAWAASTLANKERVSGSFWEVDIDMDRAENFGMAGIVTGRP